MTSDASVRVDLSRHRNNAACAFPGIDLMGGVDGFGRSYPAEELDGLDALVGALPENWGLGADDNVECDGQELVLDAPVTAVGLELVGACCGGAFRDEIEHVAGAGPHGARSVAFALSDFLATRPAHGERSAAVCSTLREHGRDVAGPRPRLWTASFALTAPAPVAALRLPVNPSVHLFGVRVLL